MGSDRGARPVCAGYGLITSNFTVGLKGEVVDNHYVRLSCARDGLPGKPGINLKTAKALGLTIPPSLLQRADQVME